MCIVTDRNENNIKVVMTVYDGIPRYAYIWHLWNNVKIRYWKSHAKLNDVFYTMTKAYRQVDFGRLMKTVEMLI